MTDYEKVLEYLRDLPKTCAICKVIIFEGGHDTGDELVCDECYNALEYEAECNEACSSAFDAETGVRRSRLR